MKKAFVAFSVVLITLFCCISVFAAEIDDSGMWEYQIYGNGVELTGYNGEQTDVYIPSKITKGEVEYSVLKLGDELFKGNTTLNSATLGEGITEIGALAFEGATNLVCIVTPKSLTKIGDKAFSGCTNFNSVILHDAVTSIGKNAFESCDKLTIYCNEGTIGYDFAVNNGIKYEILNSEAAPEIYTIDGITYCVTEGEAIIASVDVSLTDVIIPATVEGYPVTDIKTAFKNHRTLKSVTLPNSITSIGSNAFYWCDSLESVNIPDSVTDIGSNAFYWCDSLESVNIPESVTNIGSNAFAGCSSLKSVNIPNGVTSIENGTFANCSNLENIKIPDGVTSIVDSAFAGCSSLKS